MAKPWTLSIDYGTTHTCAAMAEDGEAPVVLDIEGERRFPSLVVMDGEGRLRTGKVARNLLRRFPRRGERTPKRHLGSDMLAIGVSPVEAVAAVLQRVAEEARYRNNGTDPSRVILTHPVRFDDLRRTRLRQAAELAVLPNPELLPEPVAAAFHYSARHAEVGGPVAVYDLGGGTYDTAVLHAGMVGLELAGQPGGNPDIGGERFDDLLLALVGEGIADRDPDSWARLTEPEDREDEKDSLELRAEVRDAKELLSHELVADVHVGALDRSIRITREEFERLIAQAVADTVAELERTLEAADVRPNQLSALYLTGDSTRIPAIYRALHARFSPLEPSRFDDPKAVVALGALRRAHVEPAEGKREDEIVSEEAAQELFEAMVLPTWMLVPRMAMRRWRARG
jgi:molecular chaperone DnaK (HSP70)